MPDTKNFNIARCEVRKNGIPIAVVSGLSVTKTLGRARVSQAKNARAIERPVVRIDVSGSISSYLMVDVDVVGLGLLPSTSGTDEQVVSSLIAFSGHDLDLYDEGTDSFIAKIIGFAPTSDSLNLPEGAGGTESISFEANDFFHKSELGVVA